MWSRDVARALQERRTPRDPFGTDPEPRVLSYIARVVSSAMPRSPADDVTDLVHHDTIRYGTPNTFSEETASKSGSFSQAIMG